jgi:hypothetical protein
VGDLPQESYETIVQNPLTGKPNYLSELHTRFEFTTASMLRRPDNTLQTLRWLRWHLDWDYTFTTAANGESKVRRGIATAGSITFVNPEPAPPELPKRYAVPAKVCSTLGYEASDNPNRIQPSTSNAP